MRGRKKVRRARTDITDYAIHWIKGRYKEEKEIDPFTILIADILKCGYLKPGFGMRSSVYRKSERPTIKGPYPTVCFTEQTLDNFIRSYKMPGRYSPYGIALHKRALYGYGGRPVIYGTVDLLGRIIGPNEYGYESGKEIYKGGLSTEHQYLWVEYNPIPNRDGYVIDWTHEREWRCRVKAASDEGIPILLPAVYEYNKKWTSYLPSILTSKKDEKELLVEIINRGAPTWLTESKNEYHRHYFEQLPKTNVVALEEVQEHLEAGEPQWARLETMPGIQETLEH